MRGSISRYRCADGTVTYRIRYDLPPGPEGERRQRRATYRTRREAQDALAAAVHTVATGSALDATKATVAEFIGLWLESVQQSIRPASFARYRCIMRDHVLPIIGAIRLAKLGPADIRMVHTAGLRGDRSGRPLSPTTVNNHHMVLHRALDQAVKWRLMAQNPCDVVEPPRRSRPEMQTWSADQVRTFLTVNASQPLQAAFRLALMVGLRRGELLALRWQDVDLTSGTLAVRRTQTRDLQHHFTIGEPKTAAARRSVVLPQSCVAALRRHRASQNTRRLEAGNLWEDTDLVFDNGSGAMVQPNSLVGAFERATAAAGLPRIRFHDCRHTAATLMLAQGVHGKVAQEVLGHSSIAMTLGLYSHVTPTMQHDAAARVEAALEG